MKKTARVRLTRDVVPEKYVLRLRPNLETFVFTGEETIHLSIKKPVKSITLHSLDLDIESAAIHAAGIATVAARISYDKAAETATLSYKKAIPRGDARLHLKFHGILNDRMHGFYRSSYTLDGETRHIATTQFESTDARRAFPCFDEPAQKAIFEISLTVPSASTAISNTVPVDIKEHGGGYKTVSFAPTPPMSTYLAACIVGDFEHIEKKSRDGVLVRVFTTPGKTRQARFALECAAKTIDFFNSYFAIRYPLPVVDLIAIPDFAAGAMENWGAITYRETALLVDEKNSSTMSRQWVALVIAHELAHQWFGNLVTMEWWTHLWLNEGFASYIEYLAVDHIFPSWDIWTQFLHADMRPALHADALKHTHAIEIDVHHPSEIASVFDAVSYSKGASIIRMLAEYLGEKNFRNGLRYYLKKHRYANTETVDLWRALETVSGKPVALIMGAWTRDAGYPLVTVEEDGTDLVLSQARFFSSPLSARANKEKTLWRIPISMVTPGKKSPRPFLLEKKSGRVAKTAAWSKLNADETGFYRTSYPDALRQTLGEAAQKKTLPTRDRLGLIRDVFALAENGTMSAAEALRFAALYRRETEYVVWAEIASSLGIIDALIAHESFRARLDAFARELFKDVGTRVRWDKAPKDHTRSLLRVLVLGSLSKYGDGAVRAKARAVFEAAAGNPERIPADLRSIVYSAVARDGNADDYKRLIAMYRNAAMHEEKNRIGGALGMFQRKELLKKTLAFALSKDVRHQDAVRIIAGVSANPLGTDLAWKFIQTHWKTFISRYRGSREMSYLLEPLGVASSAKRATEIERFLKKNPAPGTERTVAQVAERIRSNAAWLQRDHRALKEFLA